MTTTTTITRHPDAATLMSFAAGGLAEPLSAVVAAHVSLCAACRAEIRTMELMGGALVGSSSELADGRDGIDLPGKPDDPGPAAARDRSAQAAPGDTLPESIVRHYGLALDSVPWKRLAPGIWHHRLALSPGAKGDLRLLKIVAGRKMPVHGHGGEELTLVLDGAYADESGQYRRGDVQDVDDEIEHRPVADPVMGCICLIASERPARFKGIVERLLQPLTGM